uniref:Uncharacterized protein n=1 Tax=Schizaphis graminum TaxID=13262 RepID=A0A2S2NPJ1_SCHGA
MSGIHLSEESINVNLKHIVRESLDDIVLTASDQDKRGSDKIRHDKFFRSDGHRLQTEIAIIIIIISVAVDCSAPRASGATVGGRLTRDCRLFRSIIVFGD